MILIETLIEFERILKFLGILVRANVGSSGNCLENESHARLINSLWANVLGYDSEYTYILNFL